MTPLTVRLTALWRAERPGFPLWTPVLLGIGIQIYFWLPDEPLLGSYFLALSLPVAAFVLCRHARACWLGFGLLAFGFCLAGMRAHIVATPVLVMQSEAVVEGVVRSVERTRTGRPRLVLDALYIFGQSEADTPKRAQVALLKEADLGDIVAGDRISILARLGPPGGPVEPGGFDYRRTAWFKSLGAVGYARGPPVRIALEAAPGITRQLGLWLSRARSRIAADLREILPGERGAFAAAVMVGERGGISAESTEALRASNLAHLLAISGLHMGLVTALVFGGVRLLLALIPFTARQWPTKRVAAAVALSAATGYLALSGASVATQRAFVMAAVALVAIMLNRPALTLRALALAATVILLLRPESLLHVGFQMSFAATGALIAGFDYARLRGWSSWFSEQGGLRRRVLGYLLGLIATSLLAGAATAPFGAFHFNRVAHYGLIANLLAVPAMGFWVAPAGLLSALLAPFGLAHWPLQLMGVGIEAIMMAARFVAGLDGSTRMVASALPLALTLIVFGGLGLCLGRRLFRSVGVCLVLAGLFHWSLWTPRPDLLIAPDGRLFGVMTEGGRVLDHHSANSYAARVWLQRDGDEAGQKQAAARAGFEPVEGGVAAMLGNDWRVVHVLGRKGSDAAARAQCQQKSLVVVPRGAAPEGPCLALGRDDLVRMGAIAVDVDSDGLHVRSARERAGARLWAPPPFRGQ